MTKTLVPFIYPPSPLFIRNLRAANGCCAKAHASIPISTHLVLRWNWNQRRRGRRFITSRRLGPSQGVGDGSRTAHQVSEGNRVRFDRYADSGDLRILVAFQGALATSPPLRVDKACHTLRSISLVKNRVEPSPIAATTPPGWVLRAAAQS